MRSNHSSLLRCRLSGARARARAQTCLLYLNPAWRTADGGLLRLWSPEEDCVRASILPTLDTLAFFWSDHRTPHEVTAAMRERVAVSVWFHVPPEAQPLSSVPRNASLGRPAAVSASENAYLEGLKNAANELRTRLHAAVCTRDTAIVAAVGRFGGKAGGATTGEMDIVMQVAAADELRWLHDDEAAAAATTKCKILLQQLMPQRDVSTRCTALLLARAGCNARWLSKPRGATALIVIPLSASAEMAGASAHSKRHVVRTVPRLSGSGTCAEHRRGGWPKAADAPVSLTAGPVPVVHAFDCATTPLYLWLRSAAVLVLWALGDGVNDADVRSHEKEVALEVCEDLPM